MAKRINFHIKRQDNDHLPLTMFIPNILTLLGICCGVSSVHVALLGKFKLAVLFIIIATIIDFFDGGLARLLKAQTKMGEQLDSFADFINFGFAPAFLMYLWNLYQVKFFGWACVLLSVTCMAIRLSKFNISAEYNSSHPVRSRFFFGVPSPAAGLLILLPLVIFFEIKDTAYILSPEITCIYIAFVCLMAISNIPTFSFKKIKIKRKHANPLMLGFALLIIMCFVEQWKVFIGLSLIYFFSWFYTFYKYYYLLQKQEKNKQHTL